MSKTNASEQAPLSGKDNDSHTIDATGDCCVGDEISFTQVAVAVSRSGKPYFGQERVVVGKIVKDSYGSKKQQHTFTILLEVDVPEVRADIPQGAGTVIPAKTAGERLLIKGRNLYRNGVMRRPWPNEAERRTALDEKHERGNAARECRRLRREEEFVC